MNSLCITGLPGPNLERVSAQLFNGGLAVANPIERETTISFSDWHARATPALKRQQPLGRLWDTLAGDLLLANLHQEQWGFTDPAAVAALEYWAELEPSLNFLLLTESPEDYLAYCLLEAEAPETANETANETAWLDAWQTRNEALLAFYLAHPQRCLLVDARQAATNPQALADALASRGGFKLSPPSLRLPATQGTASTQAAPQALARYLATRLSAEHDARLAPLRAELTAACLPLGEPQPPQDADGNLLGQADLTLASLLRDYRQRCANDLTPSERDTLEQLKQQTQALESRLETSQQQEKALQQEKQALQQDLKQAADTRQADDDTREENELLLLQLHQVQEELERYFLAHQKLSDQHQALQQAEQHLQDDNRKLNHRLTMARQRLQQGSADGRPWLDYEDVSLVKEQVNPDYEHLWIRLNAPIFGDRQAPGWEFRLSCAGVRSDLFGQQPKLELPEQPDELLNHWFVESESDHGRKLELRFALPEAMDLNLWQQVAPDDQALIQELIHQLPAILDALKARQYPISRDWADWQALAADMQRIHQQTTAA